MIFTATTKLWSRADIQASLLLHARSGLYQSLPDLHLANQCLQLEAKP